MRMHKGKRQLSMQEVRQKICVQKKMRKNCPFLDVLINEATDLIDVGIDGID
jgi:hypothetical protein